MRELNLTGLDVDPITGCPRSDKTAPWRSSVYPGHAITGSGRKRAPGATVRRRITARQEGRCLYCRFPIGSVVTRHRRTYDTLTLRAEWDHFVPFGYSQTNGGDNWVLACHVCNGIKWAHMFATLEEAREWIATRRAERGYLMDVAP